MNRIFSWKLMNGRAESWGRTRISIGGCQCTGAVEAETMKKWKSKSTWRKFANELPIKMSSSSNQPAIDCTSRNSVSGSTCTLNWMVDDWILAGDETAAVESNGQISLSGSSKFSSPLEIILKFRREVSCPSWIGPWRYNWLLFF